MSIVQTNIPITSALASDWIRALGEAYPFLRVRRSGSSLYGRPIHTLSLGTGPRQVLYSAAHHANEWITATLLLKFTEDYAEAIASDGQIGGQSARDLSRDSTIHLVPLVDPDGVDLVTGALAPDSPELRRAQTISGNFPDIPFPLGWKANLAGVDLNLQYPAGWLMAREIKFSQGYNQPAPRDYVGRSPLSQPEVLTLFDETQRIDPALVLAFHTQGKVIYYKYGEIFVPGAEALAERFAALSGYALEDTPYNSSFAGYKDWFIQAYRRPGFTIEVGEGVSPLPLEQFGEIYRDNLGILLTAASG